LKKKALIFHLKLNYTAKINVKRIHESDFTKKFQF